ncbi:MAG: rod shape-determining protein RodA [Marmoricola sp.]
MTAIPTTRLGTSRVPISRARVHQQTLDLPLMGAVSAILVMGSLMVWAATKNNASLNGGHPNAFFERQLVNIAIGVVLFVVVLATDYRWLRILAPFVYVASILGLLLVMAMGSTVNGARSWIHLAGMSIEPSEFVKLAIALASAVVIAERSEGRRRPPGAWEAVAIIALYAVPAAIIMLQPDLGSTLVLSAMVFGILAVAGLSWRWLTGLLVSVGVIGTLVVSTHVLKTDQLNRLLAFTNPSLDPQGAGYNTIQARIAVGNGGVFGQGLFQGAQTRAGFVPEQHTDFIFTVAGEEFGLIGAGILVVLFAVVVWRIVRIAVRADDMFGRVAAAGIACWLAVEVFQNVGMCLGIMPVTGVPLPLVSYGGTAMFATMMGLGLVQNIHLRSHRLLR